MLRITTAQTGEGFTIRLEGRLAGPWVYEFLRVLHECGKALITVDLSDTTFADISGRDALAEAAARGVRFLTADPLMEALVRGSEHAKRNG